MLRTATLLASFAVTSTVLAQKPAADPARELDAYTAQAVKDWGAVGLAIAVVKDGRVVFEKGYGVRELGKPDLVDTTTLFAIGSTTKAMTSAAIGMLVDEPRQSVENADSLVASAIKRLAEMFARERSSLEQQWAQGGDVSTEDLRVALQRYRSFFDRLLSV